MADEKTTQEQDNQEGEAERELRAALTKATEPAQEVKPVEEKPVATAVTETTAETVKETKPTETEVTDDDLKDLPEDKPTPDHWKEMRKRYSELKKQVKAKPTEAATVKTVTEVSPLTMPEPITDTPAPEKADRIPADNVFNVLARVANGELDASYQKEAEKYITSEMTPAEIVEVYRKAQSGYFGDASDTIKAAAAQYLPIVRETSAVKERQSAAVQKATEIRARSWGEVKTLFPTLDMDKKDSPEYAVIKSAHDTLIQQIPDLWNRPEAPAIIARYAKQYGQAQQAATLAQELAAVKAELSALKQSATRKAAPIDTGGGTPPTNKSPEDELRDIFKAAGVPNA